MDNLNMEVSGKMSQTTGGKRRKSKRANIYEKKYTDEEFEKGEMDAPGRKFGLDHYDQVIDAKKVKKGYYIDENGNKKVLFVLMKKVINNKLQEDATHSFKDLSKKKNYNRGLASGKPEGSKTVRHMVDGHSMSINSSTSNIAGFYDRPIRMHKKYFKTDVACRQTAFTKNSMELWENAIPFIQRCSALYKKYGGKYYETQLKEYNKIKKDMRIPDTVFTTVTLNYNWRTSCHKDTGDYSKGLGNLAVTGRDFAGCYLGFPQFKICLKVEPGDFLLMDVHQWHCNTEMELLKPDGFRISYVLYLREHMSKCANHRVIENVHYYEQKIEKTLRRKEIKTKEV